MTYFIKPHGDAAVGAVVALVGGSVAEAYSPCFSQLIRVVHMAVVTDIPSRVSINSPPVCLQIFSTSCAAAAPECVSRNPRECCR